MISSKLEYILNLAIRKANTLNHEFLTIENVLLAMLEDKTVQEVLQSCNVNLEELRQELVEFVENPDNFSLLTEEQIEQLAREQFSNEQLKQIAEQNGRNIMQNSKDHRKCAGCG